MMSLCTPVGSHGPGPEVISDVFSRPEDPHKGSRSHGVRLRKTSTYP